MMRALSELCADHSALAMWKRSVGVFKTILENISVYFVCKIMRNIEKLLGNF